MRHSDKSIDVIAVSRSMSSRITVWSKRTWNSSAILGPSRNRRVLRQSTGPKFDVNSLNSWKTLGYMAADITSSGVISSPYAARRPESRASKSIGGSEAPGRPSILGNDLSTFEKHQTFNLLWAYIMVQQSEHQLSITEPKTKIVCAVILKLCH